MYTGKVCTDIPRIGDIVRTPRFFPQGGQPVKAIFADRREAEECGYVELTHFQHSIYDVLGKTHDESRCVRLAVVLKDESQWILPSAGISDMPTVRNIVRAPKGLELVITAVFAHKEEARDCGYVVPTYDYCGIYDVLAKPVSLLSDRDDYPHMRYAVVPKEQMTEGAAHV